MYDLQALGTVGNDTLPPCDADVFRDGRSLFAMDTWRCGARTFEAWVKELERLSGQKVDWHYSGGIANVLVLGDRQRVWEVAASGPCPARLMRIFDATDPGLYRRGVTPAPPGFVAGFYDGGTGTVFITEPSAR